MRQRYVHTLMYRTQGWNRRRSRTMSPISYGPFRDEDAAREWIRQSGITTATTLMALPAAENIRVSHGAPLQVEIQVEMEQEPPALRQLQPQQSSVR